MSAILFNDITFHYDTPFVSVFENLSFTLDTDWKTGVVGRNGKGKTTLLRLLHGTLFPIKGHITIPVVVDYFPYQPHNSSGSVLSVVKKCIAPFDIWDSQMEKLSKCGDCADMIRYGEIQELYDLHKGYQIDSLIKKEFGALGLPDNAPGRDFQTLSGGERTRALIAALFLKREAFPLIDEPTNHLDLEGRMLLADYLASKDGFILVSHDRQFLDTSTDHILSLNKNDIRIHQGSYSHWKCRMGREEEQEKRRRENLKREVKSLEDSARKRRSWSTKKEKEKIGGGDKGRIGHLAAKQMKRALSIERRIRNLIDEKKRLMKNAEKERKLKLQSEKYAPKILLSVEDIRVELGGRSILDKFSLTLYKGDRLAVVGPNGCGKTTLLQAISGEVTPVAGIVHLPRYLHVSRSFQTPRWNKGFLRDSLRDQQIEETKFRHIMAAFGVSGEVFDRPLETFSQGKRKKVDLCRSFLDPSHLLIWDEPLNYIDVISREQIEDVVLKSQPTMLFVEHDRRFIERVATGVVVLN